MKRNHLIMMVLVALNVMMTGCGNADSIAPKKAESAGNTAASATEMGKKDTESLEKNTENKEEKILLEVGAKADFMCSYDTIDQLEESAGLIIRGTVLKADTKCDEIGTVYTEYSVTINEALKGKQKKDDTIKIRRIGGVINAKEYLKQQDDPKLDELREKVEKSKEELYVKYAFDNAWLPEVGKEYVWFLCKEGGEYTPLNVYQGVYEYENGLMERFEIENEKSNIKQVKYQNCKKEIKSK